MDRVVYEEQVEKFSLGRKTGLSSRNWKARHMRLTKQALSYGENANAVPKLEILVTAISLLFTNPTPTDHPEAKGGAHYITIRFFEGGVFDLLVKCSCAESKQKWIAAFTEALERSKGSQVV